jgi:hypothetical protein
MTSVKAAKKSRKFNPKTFFSTIDGGRRIEAFPMKKTIFAQGESSGAVFYIQKGKVNSPLCRRAGSKPRSAF